MKTKFYVVVKGLKPGNFYQMGWGSQTNVEGYKGAFYKSFSKLELAEIWWEQISPETKSPTYHFDKSELSLENQSIVAEEEAGPYYTYLIIDPRTRTGIPGR